MRLSGLTFRRGRAGINFPRRHMNEPGIAAFARRIRPMLPVRGEAVALGPVSGGRVPPFESRLGWSS